MPNFSPQLDAQIETAFARLGFDIDAQDVTKTHSKLADYDDDAQNYWLKPGVRSAGVLEGIDGIGCLEWRAYQGMVLRKGHPIRTVVLLQFPGFLIAWNDHPIRD